MANLGTIETLLYALLGGILPALLWLWFWRKEDRLHPEPRRLIMYAFLGGMLVVFVVLPLERYALGVLTAGSTLLYAAWAAIEEVMKFVAAYLLVLRRRENDEPTDVVLYMITSALGFAALENALFIMNPLENGQLLTGILTGNLRFFGATLLHVLASSVVGLALALTFYRPARVRRMALLGSLVLATVLHTLFNFFILNNSEHILLVFSGVWVGIVVLLLLFEKVKKLRRPHFVYLRKKDGQ
jgi:RsiW-degrading membrane proteinase PrsW (M82 family)